MLKGFFHFFDRIEDHNRRFLSQFPILYALITGIGIVLFWRGVWETASMYGLFPPLSILIGIVIMLSIGIFVSNFIGSSIIISGLRGEKKWEEKTKDELSEDEDLLRKILSRLDKIEQKLK